MNRRLASSAVLAASLLAFPLAAQTARTVRVGQSVTDSLTDRDPTLRARRAAYQVWTLRGRPGERVVVDLMSSDFDAYLMVRDSAGRLLGTDDDSGEGQNARLHLALPADGLCLVTATAYGESSRGAYTLAVGGWEPPAAPAPGRSATIRAGETKDGILEPGDEISADGPYQDRWRFEAARGDRLRVEMRSIDLDSYLTILAPDGRVVGSDDDALGSRDAAVPLRAGETGTYTALASSYGDEPSTGAYRITLAVDSGVFAEPGATARIAMGETREGRLEEGDLTGARGREDRWTFEGRAGQGVRIDAISTAFDTYLTLLKDGVAVDSNDDGGAGQNARIIAVLPSSGTYTAVVSAYGSGHAGGRYTLALTPLNGPIPAAGRTGALAIGSRVIGRLESGDLQRNDGGLEDAWEFDARGGEEISAELRSTAFDAYLELYGPDGSLLAQDDDGLGEGTGSLITAHLSRAGRYRLMVRAYDEKSGASGTYELSLASAPAAAAPGTSQEIQAGQTVAGRLERGDSTLGDSTYADVFLFRPTASGEAVIDLRSTDFDAYLILEDAAGKSLATDDDGGEGTNARITYRVSAGQVYRIVANSYGGTRDVGSYRLSVQVTPGPGPD